MTPSECADRWGMKRNTIISSLIRGKLKRYVDSGEIRTYKFKNGTTEYYIPIEIMKVVYGDES